MSRIITFYSYKGGVGRSMTLANIATILSKWGFKVLVVDFDLEAPGLEYFFKNYIREFSDIGKKKGILNLLNSPTKLNWEELIISIYIRTKGRTYFKEIDLITSGNKEDLRYPDELNKFNAKNFYKNHNGGKVIEDLRREWKDKYDFVLLDSRTGVTDIGGICTIQLPDILLTLFTATEQGWEGTKEMAKRAVNNQNMLPFEREKLKVFPIATRIDNSEKLKTNKWLSKFADEAPNIIGDWISKTIDIRDFVNKTFIPYVPYYSFGEELAVLEETSNPLGIGYSMEGIASLLSFGLSKSRQFFSSREEYIESAIKLGAEREKLKLLQAYVQESKLIVLGDPGSGKTTLVNRILHDSFSLDEYKNTHGISLNQYDFKARNNKSIKINIWDFGGQEIYHLIHNLFLTKNTLYIIVIDPRSEDENILFWLETIGNYASQCPVIIFQNTRGDYHREIKQHFLNEKFNNVIQIIEGDLREIDCVKLLRTKIEEEIQSLSHIKQILPESWIRIKSKIENILVSQQYISVKEYNNICEENDLTLQSGKLNLLEYLSDIGIVLWYKNDEKINTLILNPVWISEGVYKIINWVSEEKGHNIRLKDFDKVFFQDVKRYPKDKHEFLFNLIKHLELGFEIARDKSLIIPHLLNEDLPELLPEFPVDNSLMLRYVAEQALPSNTISRFIVRHNEEIKKESSKYIVWRYGVVLEDGNGSLALVREEDRTISVSVKGNDKTNYISILRETLNDIFDTYKSDKPELQYRIERYGQIPDTNELWLPDRKIKNLYGKKKPYYDDETDQDISMGSVVTTYNINAPHTIIAGHDIDNSTHYTFNFKDCNIGLQGNLNELAQLLSEGGSKEEAKELENAAKLLEQVEECQTKEEVKKKGIGNRLKRIVDELGDEGSKLHKTVKKIKYGVGIAQDIAQTYNDIAQWLGMPQVPKPFLKK